VLGNPDFPHAQGRLRAALVRSLGHNPGKDALLDAAVARFKTPGLRDLGHSDPYMHDRAFDTLEDAVGFYIQASNAQRAGTLRNGAPELAGVAISGGDVAALAAFLRSLNEDYQ
jgi:cytochrome c peroxidase